MRDRCLCKNMQKVVSEFGVQVNWLVLGSQFRCPTVGGSPTSGLLRMKKGLGCGLCRSLYEG